MALKISKALLRQLREHGEQTYPHECCGVLVGDLDPRTVTRVVRCSNTSTGSPRNRYSIDPSDLIRIRREAAQAGETILGFYHSHPDSSSHWSTTDLAEAYWTGCSYVITSVQRGKALLTNSFLLLGEDDQTRHFEDEAIEA